LALDLRERHDPGRVGDRNAEDLSQQSRFPNRTEGEEA
jgi:hypothetical protein